MNIRDRLSGNEAVSLAIRQVNPDVMPAFPITPSTEIPQYVSSYIANGECDTVFIPVESEHSALSAAIGASAAGARSVTATSSCGLAYMWELLYVAASDRLPIVMALVNRTLSGPININCDHSDSMGARDAGWIQIYSESNQEAYDNFIQAFPIAEHPDIMLPVMVCQDGFITSHGVENIEILEDRDVKGFVGEYEPKHYLLNNKEKMAVGPYAVSSYIMEAKRQQAEAMFRSKEVIKKVADDFKKISGRGFCFFEEYRMEDAEYAMIIMGSAAGAAKEAVDRLRNRGMKAGLLKIRLFRPFPAEEIAEALKGVKAIAVMDRAESFSTQGGPLAAELKAALFNAKMTPDLTTYMYGLGGRDVQVEDIQDVFSKLDEPVPYDEGLAYHYMGLRK